jgi:hypothetical protein
MKNHKQGLIFCHTEPQKLIFENIQFTLTSNSEVKKYFILHNIVTCYSIESKKIVKQLSKLKFLTSLIPNTDIDNTEKYYLSKVKINYRRKKTSKIKFLDIKKENISFYIPGCNYGVINILSDYSYSTLKTISSKTNFKLATKTNFNKVYISIDSFDKVNEAMTKVKGNIFKDFSNFVTKFFKNIQDTIVPIFNRRELKNEIQVIGEKISSKSQLVININHERLAVTNFIRSLGLENFSSSYLDINLMVEAIRLYEVGEHQQFKDYTLMCVNKALKAIERKLIILEESERIQALKEMNSLDSLKFMVELITDDQLMELPALEELEMLSLSSGLRYLN